MKLIWCNCDSKTVYKLETLRSTWFSTSLSCQRVVRLSDYAEAATEEVGIYKYQLHMVVILFQLPL